MNERLPEKAEIEPGGGAARYFCSPVCLRREKKKTDKPDPCVTTAQNTYRMFINTCDQSTSGKRVRSSIRHNKPLRRASNKLNLGIVLNFMA